MDFCKNKFFLEKSYDFESGRSLGTPGTTGDGLIEVEGASAPGDSISCRKALFVVQSWLMATAVFRLCALEIMKNLHPVETLGWRCLGQWQVLLSTSLTVSSHRTTSLLAQKKWLGVLWEHRGSWIKICHGYA